VILLYKFTDLLRSLRPIWSSSSSLNTELGYYHSNIKKKTSQIHCCTLPFYSISIYVSLTQFTCYFIVVFWVFYFCHHSGLFFVYHQSIKQSIRQSILKYFDFSDPVFTLFIIYLYRFHFAAQPQNFRIWSSQSRPFKRMSTHTHTHTHTHDTVVRLSGLDCRQRLVR